MNRVIALFFGALFIFLPQFVLAEIYQGIAPNLSLGEIKSIYPKANFARLTVAWAQEDEVLYEVTGAGIPNIVLKFRDERVAWKNPAPNSSVQNEMQDEETARRGRYIAYIASKVINAPDDIALSVEWVRLVPAKPIPIKRLISRYGKYNETFYNEADMTPNRHWRRGITATLSDDESNAILISYEFTSDELAKFGFNSQWTKLLADVMSEANSNPPNSQITTP